MKPLLLFISFLCLTSLTWAQEELLPDFKNEELMLVHAFDSLYQMQASPSRATLNERIVQIFNRALHIKGSINYGWEGLSMIGKIESEDERLKVFTWHLELEEGNFKYFGFIQYLDDKDSLRVFFLRDESAKIKSPETASLHPDNWYGALYYGMKTFQSNKDTYYALFGYDFNNRFSRKRILEIFRFGSDYSPVFEGDFLVENKEVKRFIIEYSAELAMSMKYNEHLKMIVFDHVAPFQPMLSGNPRFYGPDGTFDGFSFNNGKFVFFSDIDARNY